MHPSHHHRRYHLHGIRVVLIGVSLLALCFARFDAAALTQPVASPQVLAYATNINRGDLLAQTNAARTQNGLAPLTLNSKLNSSGQSKAQHMITYNYWAHVAPDGTQPWYFFDQAGYAYQSAGENLAYGFDSSAGTVNAWMNSPSHRANILGAYVDVGFGIANGENYQGSPNTVVVAHYGTPRTVEPAPAPTEPTPPPPPAPAPAPDPTPAPTTPAPVVQETAEEPVPEEPKPLDEVEPETTTETAAVTDEDNKDEPPAVATTASKNINLLQSVGNGTAPPYGVISLVLLVTSAIGFIFTHRALFQHALVTSEHYVVKHPMVDIAAVGVVSMFVLSTTVSRI